MAIVSVNSNSLFFLLLGGAIVGLISYWGQREVNFQLTNILDSLKDRSGPRAELSVASLVRREILRLQQEKQALLQDSQRWQYLLLRAPLGYLQVDKENQLIWCNEQARQILSIDRWQKGQVRLLLELVRSWELDQLIEKTRNTGESLNCQWVFYPAYYPTSNQSITLEATSYCLENANVGVFLTNQEALSQERKNWDRSISDLMHDFRTPLTSISLVAETLSDSLQGQEKKWSDLIVAQSNRLIKLVGTWLDMSQLQENSKKGLNYQEVELHQLIELAWQGLESRATIAKINLSYSGPERIYLKADGVRLIQVFTNLLENAIKHSSPGKSIFVEVEPLEASVAINVIDEGPGFSQKDLPYVFERLYRGSYAREHTKSDHGNGLGLSIVQEIIGAHQGTITAQNHPTTGGAWLKINLPSGSD